MADGPGRGARLPATFRSPERYWRTAAFVLLALLAGWYFAVRHDSAAGVTTGSVLAAALLVTAWRVHHGRLIADSHGLTDYRAIRIVQMSWDDITGFDVAKPAGPWGGFCVRALQRTGKPVDLLATRGYSMIPSRSSYDEVHRMMWTLTELRPTATNE